MFEIKTLLQLPSFKPTGPLCFENPDEQFISIDNELKLRDYFNHPKFTPKHIQMLITIRYQNKIVVGEHCPSGLDLWNDFVQAIKVFLEEGSVELNYGIDPILMKMSTINNTFLTFELIDDWESNEVYTKATLPKKEFLYALLDGAIHFWTTLHIYQVFKKRAYRISTPKDYPQMKLNEIHRLKEQVKTLLDKD
ncbi:hypothetical protein AM500_13955 [Bacillus sp. FJAT-18017]|uniref:hypothetical protein n=1 Tax=Bacillus sp. FJAT-18017 TaxID=1705566 RepID=UPI0006AE20EA|nr:hypothetical protein [Bacillus sp. FJAT-18017]ALC90768.1 hypothetical protein AM500_13955 [Bacillus sp. FJAT-18017]